ncbi:M15 family metallopeptidase [Noviluteimonas gilva]|nr:M15 family metallopeptidase [Lysobacter gilvus]
MRFSRHALLSTIALFATACATQQNSAPISPATTPEDANLVDIRSLVPDIDLDIRYAGANNFTGAPVDGYEAPKCFLLRPVAEALARVERTLRDDHMRLRLYDCYRPVRAVQNFVAWAHAPEDGRTKAAYYPSFDKRALLGDYISPTSGHSRGATVDLDLMECDDTGVACTPLDMGTHFDFFDTLANTDSKKATDAQRANRHRLRDAMEAQGFRNYPMEWWHFTLKPEPSPRVAFDIPVR